MSEAPFKTCTNCFQKWNTVTEFLEDSATVILGYQASFNELHSGLLLFNHETCANTLAFYVDDFSYLRSGSVFVENKSGKDGCPGYCFQKEQLSSCQNSCECRWVRDVIQVIKNWEKTS